MHKCRFAEQCRFIHVAGPNPIAIPERGPRPPRNGPPRGGAPRTRSRNRSRPVQSCRNFASDGKCDFGELCRFKHGEADSRDMVSSASYIAFPLNSVFALQ